MQKNKVVYKGESKCGVRERWSFESVVGFWERFIRKRRLKIKLIIVEKERMGIYISYCGQILGGYEKVLN